MSKKFFPQKDTLKNYFENPSRLSLILAGSLLLPLIGFLLWLSASLRTFRLLIALYSSSGWFFQAPSDFQNLLNHQEHGKIAETIVGEGGRCTGKRKKAVGAMSIMNNSNQYLKKLYIQFLSKD